MKTCKMCFRSLIKIKLDHPCATLIDYQPGNGTRYSVCFTFLGKIDSDAAKYQIGGHDTIVSIENLRKCMTVSYGHNTHENYIAEKLNLNLADARPLAELINFVCSEDFRYRFIKDLALHDEHIRHTSAQNDHYHSQVL